MLFAVLAIVGMGRLVTGPTAVRAQEATPAASPTAIACTVTPRPVDFLVTVVAAPKPETTPTPITTAPSGTPVDAQTAAAITQLIDTLTLCVNEGDYLRAFSFFDDAYLRRIIDPDGLMDGEVAFELGKSLATPSSNSNTAATVSVEIVSIETQADGTVVALFRTTDEASGDTGTVDLYVLVQRDGNWVIIDGARDIRLQP